MVALIKISAPPIATQCKAINWTDIELHVLRLQMRIAKVTRDGKRGNAKALQWILTYSRVAKLLTVKLVLQNKGSKTPGIDGIIWNTDVRCWAAVNQLSRKGNKAKSIRRIYIPKKTVNSEN
ncbi:reverse transcriptase N-terminal domain-containing protein [uncultured Shewanella sp.]|uniref:reverse transcriptase N-terminal domain-containing protein n=1 Tax=uncultured Shewanella sp. TaxID=173975 RepID=UPI00261BE6D3|nr:reverse transcriptase N-terminal domain-containing protein [uncultured Shewanella sp.]